MFEGYYVFYNEQWSCIFHPMPHENSRRPSVWILSPSSQSNASKHQHHNPLLTPRSSSPSNPSTLGVLGVGGCPSQRPAVIGQVEPMTSEEVRREGEGQESVGNNFLGNCHDHANIHSHFPNVADTHREHTGTLWICRMGVWNSLINTSSLGLGNVRSCLCACVHAALCVCV